MGLSDGTEVASAAAATGRRVGCVVGRGTGGRDKGRGLRQGQIVGNATGELVAVVGEMEGTGVAGKVGATLGSKVGLAVYSGATVDGATVGMEFCGEGNGQEVAVVVVVVVVVSGSEEEGAPVRAIVG